MIYISTHKDFTLPFKKETIDNLKQDLTIIDGAECKNLYPINVIHETELNNDIYYKHDMYGELTRIYYIYKNINIYDTDIIGFIQYRRIFDDDLLLNHKRLMNDYDLICQIPYQQYGIFTDDGGYSNRYLERCIKLIAKNIPEYKEYIDILYKDSKMICHNMFIMHKIDFIKYCDFLFGALRYVCKRN